MLRLLNGDFETGFHDDSPSSTVEIQFRFNADYQDNYTPNLTITICTTTNCQNAWNIFSEQKSIISILYRLQLGITFNVHTIYRVSGNLSEDIPLKMIGSGVYQDFVLLNHSCAPNTTRSMMWAACSGIFGKNYQLADRFTFSTAHFLISFKAPSGE